MKFGNSIMANKTGVSASQLISDTSVNDISITTQNRFADLGQDDTVSEHENGGDVVFPGEWQKIVNSRKRQKISSSGSENINIDDYKSLSLDDKLAVMYVEISSNKTQMSEIGNKLDTCLKMGDSLKSIENKVDSFEARMTLLEYKSLDIEARSRRHNLLFSGFTESRNENCKTLISLLARETLQIDKDIVIDRAHRLGRFKQGQKRSVIVAFRDYSDVELVLSKANKLKGSEYSINRDFPKEIANARRSLWGEYKDLKRQCPSSKINLVYPAKIVQDGRVVRDCFPNWDNIMSNTRINAPSVSAAQPAQMSTNRSRDVSREPSQQTTTSSTRKSRSPRRRSRQQVRTHAPTRQPSIGPDVETTIKRPWVSTENNSETLNLNTN